MHAKLLQSCPTLCNPMNCSIQVSSVHGILLPRILEGVVITYLPDPEIEPKSPAANATGRQTLLLVLPGERLVGNSGNYFGYKFIVSEEESVVFLIVVFLNITFLPYSCFLTFLSLFSNNFLDVILKISILFWGI